MRLLLDAHVIVWWDSGSSSLGIKARQVILNANAVYVSAVSEWEIAFKAGLGKIALRRTVQEAAVEAGFELLPISFSHVQGIKTLKPIHKDPFDRLLVAAALAEGLTIVTSDALIPKYPVTIVDARK